MMCQGRWRFGILACAGLLATTTWGQTATFQNVVLMRSNLLVNGTTTLQSNLTVQGTIEQGGQTMDSRYVNTAGDTMTGALSTPSFQDTNVVSKMAHATADSTTNYVRRTGGALSGYLYLPGIGVGAVAAGSSAGMPFSIVGQTGGVISAVAQRGGDVIVSAGQGGAAATTANGGDLILSSGRAAAYGGSAGTIYVYGPLLISSNGYSSGTVTCPGGFFGNASGLTNLALANIPAYTTADSTTNYVRRTGDAMSGDIIAANYSHTGPLLTNTYTINPSSSVFSI